VTSETLARFQRDGYVVISAVLDAAEVAACIRHLRRLQAEGCHMGPIVTAPLTTDAYLAGIAGSPGLTEIAGCLLEAKPVPFGCTYFVKEPRGGLPVRWHQDGHPWQIRLGITQAVTLWIALDRADEQTGGLQVVPASHVLAAQPLRPHQGQPSVFGSEIDPLLVDETVARPVRLAPGDVSAHHPNLIHGSPPNRSDYPRRGLAIRYRPGRGRAD
jgi:ectoine hydroxylase-related dioxygenase (phytanoyl-CoA dioxygenase family)